MRGQSENQVNVLQCIEQWIAVRDDGGLGIFFEKDESLVQQVVKRFQEFGTSICSRNTVQGSP